MMIMVHRWQYFIKTSSVFMIDILLNHHRATVYPKKYAHGFCFAMLCCGYTLTDFPISIRLTSLALWQSNDCPSASKATLMNMDECFMWIHYERLHDHNKAKHNKTVCIFLGIYCNHTNTVSIQYIPRNKHTVTALLCFVVVIHWLIFPYPSGLLHWHCGNLTIAPVPAKQHWWIWMNASCEFIMNDCITTTKQSTTKPCAYFLGYTVITPTQCVYVMGYILFDWILRHFPQTTFIYIVEFIRPPSWTSTKKC